MAGATACTRRDARQRLVLSYFPVFGSPTATINACFAALRLPITLHDHATLDVETILRLQRSFETSLMVMGCVRSEAEKGTFDIITASSVMMSITVY
jgi:hypothetical protein